MKVKIAVENLGEVKSVLDKKGIVFWLDSGTLLGAVRDGKIIEWDNDIDLGTWNKNINKIISAFPEFKKRGFNVVLDRKLAGLTIERSDVNINVDLYFERGDYAWKAWIITNGRKTESLLRRCLNMSNLRTYAQEAGKIKHFSSLLPSILKQLITETAWLALDRLNCVVPVVIPKRYFEKLSQHEFYGMLFRIPDDAEKYLEQRYGSDWRKPKQEWIYYRDDRAILLNWDARRSET